MPVVHYVRHGQASFGAADYDVLSGTGQKQAELVGDALARAGVRPDRILAGTLKRQQDTAVGASVAAPFDLPVESDPRWNEYDHLALLRAHPATAARSLPAGPESSQVFQAALDAALVAWIRTGSNGSAGRTWVEYRDGVLSAQQELLESLGRGGTAIVFTSGGVIAAVGAALLGLGAEGFASLNRVTVNTGITKVVHGRSGTSLLSFNEHAHLIAVAGMLTYR
jgi:broad specificity phosphatase PhoE